MGDHGMSSPPAPSPFPGGNDTPSGPGHYTMVRKGLSPDPGPSAQMAPSLQRPGSPEEAPKPVAKPSRRSSVLTVIALVAVVLTIVALVVVFALLE